ncbi:MAG: response regulator [Chloroflexi bacterium]|nr:response regulator [Chloroflexota bacterium]MBU1751386.1 response regulator [Chloroflexota bacterium]
MDDLVTVQEVAHYLKMSPQTIYRFAQQGRIPALKVGSRWRFRLTDIEGWLQQQKDEPTSILVVDSHTDSHRLFDGLLADGGYQITTVCSGTEALRAIQQRHYALVFLSLMMPDMNGLDMLQEMREIGRELRIVIMAGQQDSDLLEQALRLGPFTVLPRPCGGDQIRNTISMLMD